MAPGPLLLLLIAIASGALAHLLWGRRWVQLPLFLAAAGAGCILISISGLRVLPALFAPAGVPVLEATMAAWLLLVVASRLRV